MTYFEIASIINALIELIFVIIDRCNKKWLCHNKWLIFDEK